MKLIVDTENPLLEISTSLGFRLIPIYRIVLIKAERKGSIIILHDSEQIITRNLLTAYETLLPYEIFYRCHNSYIINFSYIKSYNGHEIRFSNGSIALISRTKSRTVREKLIRFVQIRKISL